VSTHIESAPWKLPLCALQLASVISRHVAVASGMQHAPVGGGHGFGVHMLPLPW
jgi:hypothetical protein